MSREEYIRHLLHRYLESRCTREELQEFLALLESTGDAPYVARALREYWDDLPPYFSLDDTLSRESKKWFDEIYRRSVIREHQENGGAAAGRESGLTAPDANATDSIPPGSPIHASDHSEQRSAMSGDPLSASTSMAESAGENIRQEKTADQPGERSPTLRLYKKRGKRKPARGSQLANIAAILMVAFGLALAWTLVKPAEMEEATEVYITKSAGMGEKVRFTLSDGTQVHLNAESSLRYPAGYHEENRTVYLTGEAYFVVAKNENSPFLVRTENITTRVLGTSFNVRSYPDEEEVVVAVESGKVAVREANGEPSLSEEIERVVLEAGQWAGYNIQTLQFKTATGDISEFVAWNRGILLHHDKEMSYVATQLERWYGVEITFQSELLKKCVIRGEYENETLENVLNAISYALNIEFRIDGRNVLLIGEGCQ